MKWSLATQIASRFKRKACLFVFIDKESPIEGFWAQKNTKYKQQI
jgi:hypothetical protein